MRESWKDTRYIKDGAGHTATVWQYTPEPGSPIYAPDSDTPSHGTGPGTIGLWTDAMERHGHAITEASGARPWHHHVDGVGHDDAHFTESGASMAAYYENGRAFGGAWWEARAWHRKYYGPPRTAPCLACGAQLTQGLCAVWTDDAGLMTCPEPAADYAEHDHEPAYPPVTEPARIAA